MKCYTVSEGAVPGILPTEIGGEFYLMVGVGGKEHPATTIPVGKILRDAMSELKAKDQPYSIYAADFSDDGERIVGELDKRSRQALVLVQTQAGEPPTNPNPGEPTGLLYAARSYDEEINSYGRVVQVPHPFIRGTIDSWFGHCMAGIEVVATGFGPHGEAHSLLIMNQDASFRLFRTGDVGDAPRELFVRWSWEYKEQQMVLSSWTSKRYQRDRKKQKAA